MEHRLLDMFSSLDRVRGLFERVRIESALVVKEKKFLTNSSHVCKMAEDQKTAQDIKQVTEQV